MFTLIRSSLILPSSFLIHCQFRIIKPSSSRISNLIYIRIEDRVIKEIDFHNDFYVLKYCAIENIINQLFL